jgi:protein TonB
MPKTMMLLLILGTGLLFSQTDHPIRVGGNVAATNLISQLPHPVYPPEAKQNRIQGIVTLEVTIDQQGRVSDLKPVSGPPELIQSAIDSVSQWLYKPTLLNGEPVTVLTTVNVNYTLSD